MPFPALAIPIIGDLIKGGLDIIDKMVPDKDAAMKMKQELMLRSMEIEREYLSVAAQESKNQTEINKVEAAGNWYQAGWRPTLGYICALGFLYTFVAYPFLQWYIAFKGIDVVPPPVLSDNLLELTLGMLGLGMLRTWEKIRIGASKSLIPGKDE